MKIISILCSAILFFSTFAQDPDDDNDDSGSKPKIYADLSKSAKEDAVSFGGVHVLLGILFSSSGYNASVGNSNNTTKHNFNQFGFSLGMEYAKEFHRKFLLGIDVEMEFPQKYKKEGSWQDINKEFETRYAATYPGNRTAKLESSAIRPSVSIKCALLIKKHKFMLFTKVGVVQGRGSSCFRRDNDLVNETKFNKCQPTFAVGLGASINRKVNASLEVGMSSGANSTKILNNTEQKINRRRSLFIKAAAVFSVNSRTNSE
jgi:hypothetical protein